MAYDRLIADVICSQVAEGSSIAAACRTVGIAPSTFRSWVLADHDGLAERSARAIEMGCDALAEDSMAVAEKPLSEDEIAMGAKTALGLRRLVIDTRLRLLGKWSKRYAEKQQIDANVKSAVTMMVNDDDAKL